MVSDYLGRVLNHESFGRTIEVLAKLLEPHSDKFDTIVFRGMSGALVGPALAHALKKDMLLVRKPEEKNYSHSAYPAEGNYELEKYIIVDDLIASGKTIRQTIETVSKLESDCLRRIVEPTRCVGVITYVDPSINGYQYGGRVHQIIKELIGSDDFFLISACYDIR